MFLKKRESEPLGLKPDAKIWSLVPVVILDIVNAILAYVGLNLVNASVY